MYCLAVFYRYAQVEGLPPGTALTIAARVVHSDVESSSVLRFEEGTAAPLLNQLQSNIEWTQRDNLHSVPTDCDQRTERQGWMADASVSAEQAYHNFAMGPFYRNWFQSVRIATRWSLRTPHPEPAEAARGTAFLMFKRMPTTARPL